MAARAGANRNQPINAGFRRFLRMAQIDDVMEY